MAKTVLPDPRRVLLLQGALHVALFHRLLLALLDIFLCIAGAAAHFGCVGICYTVKGEFNVS